MKNVLDNIPASFAALVVGAVAISLIVPTNYLGGLVLLSCIYALLGLSVNMIYGYLGYTSFGHAAFVGLGAYASVLVTIHAGVGFWLAAAIALIPGVLLGIAVAFLSLRISGVYFAVTSLTVAEILRLVSENWIELTSGPAGLIMPRPDVSWLRMLGLSYQQSLVIIGLVVVGACFVCVRRLLSTPTGRAWAAIRVGQDLSESIGIPTFRYRILNVAISGALGALTGALLMPKILVVTPYFLSPHYSAIGLLIVVLGGRRSLLGPVIGGVLFACLPELLREAGELRVAIFGLLLLIVVRVLPDGISTLLLPKRKRHETAPTDLEASSLNSAEDVDTDNHVEPGHYSFENAEIVLEIYGLTKRFRGLTAVDSLDFSVRDGEILGLMGPNGAGKSTCLNLISGFLAPDAGSVRFLGKDIIGMQPNRVARAGLVRTFQHTTVFTGLTVFESVLTATQSRCASNQFASFFRRLSYRREEERRIAMTWKTLRRVGLEMHANRFSEEMSYGEQRLLSIALALATQPKVLLLDEPAAGLNPVEAKTLSRVLHFLRREGLTIILVEHNVPMMMDICDRLLVVHHGEKIAEGSPTEIRDNVDVRAAYFGNLEVA